MKRTKDAPKTCTRYYLIPEDPERKYYPFEMEPEDLENLDQYDSLSDLRDELKSMKEDGYDEKHALYRVTFKFERMEYKSSPNINS